VASFQLLSIFGVFGFGPSLTDLGLFVRIREHGLAAPGESPFHASFMPSSSNQQACSSAACRIMSVLSTSLCGITLSDIDQMRALGAEDVHPKAQRFRLSITVHGPHFCGGVLHPSTA
jgi:hypothetical protein